MSITTPTRTDRKTVGGALRPDSKHTPPPNLQNRGIKPLLQPGIQHGFAGAVLAGGKSSRMGRNKALLRVGGEPLWLRQLRVLGEAGAKPVFLVQAPGQRALTSNVLRDTVRDAGPLAGVHAALSKCEEGHLAVLAVDLPQIGHDWFARLGELCTRGVGVVARGANGYEPLAAIYPREALTEAAARLESHEFALQKFVSALVRSRRMRVLRLTSIDHKQFANWNAPGDVK